VGLVARFRALKHPAKFKTSLRDEEKGARDRNESGTPEENKKPRSNLCVSVVEVMFQPPLDRSTT
jgi:hypothetical protein